MKKLKAVLIILGLTATLHAQDREPRSHISFTASWSGNSPNKTVVTGGSEYGMKITTKHGISAGGAFYNYSSHNIPDIEEDNNGIVASIGYMSPTRFGFIADVKGYLNTDKLEVGFVLGVKVGCFVPTISYSEFSGLGAGIQLVI